MPESTTTRAGVKPPEGTAFIDEVLGGNVRAFRLLRLLEQASVAERMRYFGHGWSQSTVAQVERGHRNVTVPELVSLTLALDVTIDQLLDPRGPERRIGPDLALARGANLVLASDPAQVVASGLTVVLPASEVTALVCAHEIRKRSTWIGATLAEVQLEDEEAGQ